MTTRRDNPALLFRREHEMDEDGRGDSILRLSMMAAVELCLETIIDRANDEEVLYYAANGLYALACLYDCSEAVIARHEANRKWDSFRLLHRQLAGLALEMGVLAARMPEVPCNSCKAQLLNRVLRPLKERMEEDMGVVLSLVSGEGQHTYSDVSLLLRTYLDVSAAYVQRHYNGNPPVIPPVPPDWASRLVQDQILMFCRQEPKTILQIGDLLGYRDKKTIRKYLNPLLSEGLLARTVPDKPNSRNQRYITARDC